MQTKTHGENIKQPNQPGRKPSEQRLFAKPKNKKKMNEKKIIKDEFLNHVD